MAEVDGGQVCGRNIDDLVVEGESRPRGVDRPPVPGRCAGQRGRAEGRVESADVQHDGTTPAGGIDRVVDVARLDIDPPDGAGRTPEGHDADPGPGLGVPAVGDGVGGRVGHHLHRSLHVEQHGKVHEDHVGLRDGEVMHHHRPGQRHRLAADQGPSGVVDPILEERLGEAVAERVHPAGRRVDLRVGRHVGVPTAVARQGADRREVGRVEHIGDADFAQRQGPAGEVDHRHVRQGAGSARGTRRTQPAAVLVEAGADPAVPVPGGASGIEPHPVDHAVTQEPVGRLPLERVGSVTHVETGELVGKGAGHGQLGHGRFGLYRAVVPLEPPPGASRI